MRFEGAIAVAAHHLPPGYAMCIQNKRPIPQDISGKQPSASEATESGGGRTSEATGAGSAGHRAEAQQVPIAFEKREPVGESDTHFFAWNEGAPDEPELAESASVFWHGTSAHNLPYIMAEGFRPSIGAGADQVMQHYGIAVPGVYVTPSWSVAASYPMTRTTGPVTINGEKFKGGLAGASLVARDGTYPMRALIRCVAQRYNRLWHRDRNNNKQSMFMPQHLHIAHIYLYIPHGIQCVYSLALRL